MQKHHLPFRWCFCYNHCMGKHIHVMENNVCKKCKDKTLLRKIKGRWVCKNSTNRWTGYTYTYRHSVKEKCGLCSFVATHPCQLDIDHKDGNHRNNSKENLWILCANCHRLKTYQQKEGIYRQRI